MKILILLIIIFNIVSKADKKKDIDTNHVSNLNKIAMEMIGVDNIAAKKMLDSAFQYAFDFNSHYWVAKTYQNIGIYHLKNDSLVRASEYLEIAAKAFENVKLFDDEAYSNIILADLYYSIKRYEKGLEILKRSEKNIDKINSDFANSLYLKISEMYNSLSKSDSAEIYRLKVDLNKNILDFKIDLESNKVNSINNDSQIVELKRELEVQQMKTDWIVWVFLIIIILLALIVLILSVKLYNAKKEIYNLKEKEN